MSDMTPERWKEIEEIMRSGSGIHISTAARPLFAYAKQLRQELVNADVAMEVARKAWIKAAQDECKELRENVAFLRKKLGWD